MIVGVRERAQLEDNLAAADLVLTPQELDALDATSALPEEYPGWMFKVQSARATQLHDAGRAEAR